MQVFGEASKPVNLVESSKNGFSDLSGMMGKFVSVKFDNVETPIVGSLVSAKNGVITLKNRDRDNNEQTVSINFNLNEISYLGLMKDGLQTIGRSEFKTAELSQYAPEKKETAGAPTSAVRGKDGGFWA